MALVVSPADLSPASADTMYTVVPSLASQLRETTFISQFTVAAKFWATQGSVKKQGEGYVITVV